MTGPLLSLMKQFKVDHSLSGNVHKVVTGKGVSACLCPLMRTCLSEICTRDIFNPYYLFLSSKSFIQRQTQSAC